MSEKHTMTSAAKLLALAETDGYNYLLSDMKLCAKRGYVSMKLLRDTLEHFKERLQSDGFEVLYDSVSWARAKTFDADPRPFNQ